MSLSISLVQNEKKVFEYFGKYFLIYFPFLAMGKYIPSLVAYVATMSR